MAALSDSDLLRGIHELINPQNVKTGTNYEEIESKLISSGKVKQDTKDPTESYKNELSDLAKTLGLKFDSPSAKSAKSARNDVDLQLSAGLGSSRRGNDDQRIPSYSDTYNTTMGSSPRNNSPSPSPKDRRTSTHSFTHTSTSSPLRNLGLPSSFLQTADTDNNDDTNDTDDSSGDSPASDDRFVPTRSSGAGPKSPFPNFDYRSAKSPLADSRSNIYLSHDSPRASPSSYGGSSELERRTREQSMHDQVKNVMSTMGSSDAHFISLEEANKEDEKTNMLEEVDSLRASLEEEDAKGLDKIPIVTQANSYSEVENVLRRLRLKNDRARYTGLADEFLLWGAQGMEELFDGKRKWLGKNPDLTGWSKEVHVKLRRMRHDTSTLVSGVMHDYNIGPGARILLELVPNMFMYAKRRKQNYGKSNLYADVDIAKHMNNIRSIDEE